MPLPPLTHTTLSLAVASVQRGLDKLEALAAEKRKTKRLIRLWLAGFEKEWGRPPGRAERRAAGATGATGAAGAGTGTGTGSGSASGSGSGTGSGTGGYYDQYRRLSQLVEAREGKVRALLAQLGLSYGQFLELRRRLEGEG